MKPDVLWMWRKILDYPNHPPGVELLDDYEAGELICAFPDGEQVRVSDERPALYALIKWIGCLALVLLTSAAWAGKSKPYRFCQFINCHDSDETRECNICSPDGSIRFGSMADANWTGCHIPAGSLSCVGIQHRIVCDEFCVKGRLREGKP